jgi:hypothetical protein
MKWISYWMMIIAIIHTGLAIVLFGSAYMMFLRKGVWNTVSTDGDRLALWFLVAGAMMFLMGYLFSQMHSIPKLAGVLLGLIGLVGGLLLPPSGFWLLIPPAIGILLHRQ